LVTKYFGNGSGYCQLDSGDCCVVVDGSYRGIRGGYRGGPVGYGGGREANADRLVDQLQELVGVLAYVTVILYAAICFGVQ